MKAKRNASWLSDIHIMKCTIVSHPPCHVTFDHAVTHRQTHQTQHPHHHPLTHNNNSYAQSKKKYKKNKGPNSINIWHLFCGLSPQLTPLLYWLPITWTTTLFVRVCLIEIISPDPYQGMTELAHWGTHPRNQSLTN